MQAHTPHQSQPPHLTCSIKNVWQNRLGLHNTLYLYFDSGMRNVYFQVCTNLIQFQVHGYYERIHCQDVLSRKLLDVQD